MIRLDSAYLMLQTRIWKYIEHKKRCGADSLDICLSLCVLDRTKKVKTLQPRFDSIGPLEQPTHKLIVTTFIFVPRNRPLPAKHSTAKQRLLLIFHIAQAIAQSPTHYQAIIAIELWRDTFLSVTNAVLIFLAKRCATIRLHTDTRDE